MKYIIPAIHSNLRTKKKLFLTHGRQSSRVHFLTVTLQWRHNGHDSVSNHQPHDCLLSRLFRRRSKKTSKLRVTGLCAGKSPGTGEFPAQMASNAENVSIWWRHHGCPVVALLQRSGNQQSLFILRGILDTNINYQLAKPVHTSQEKICVRWANSLIPFDIDTNSSMVLNSALQ